MSDAPQATGQIPTSTALAEATTDSLAELFSRDPENYSKQDLERVVAELRAQRERLAAAEGAAGAKPKKAPTGAPVTLKSTVALGDLDL